VRQELFSPALANLFKMEKKDFTRTRKQSFLGAMLFMISQLNKSLSVEIDIFVGHLNDKLSAGVSRFTSSAFIQNRKKINPDVFKHLSSVIIKGFYRPENAEVKLFYGLRVLAADSSGLTLPFTKELQGIYGVISNAQPLDIVQAKISILFDVMNKLTLDVALGKGRASERELALSHRGQWRKGDLIIYDRGYPSFEFIYEHIKAGVDCLIRAKTVHSNLVKEFLTSGKRSLVTLMYPDLDKSFRDKDYNRKTSIQVRLLRIELSGGETEVLITTLLDSHQYPSKIFKELYFKRWGIETFIDELKNKLKIEHFSGYADHTIRQDLACAIFISNLQAVIISSIAEELEEQNNQRMYDYKVNTNLSYGFLKNRVIELLHQKGSTEQVLAELEVLFLQHTIPIRPGRTNPRNTQKYRYKDKPIVTKNHKDSL
jgi:hypothetical protein